VHEIPSCAEALPTQQRGFYRKKSGKGIRIGVTLDGYEFVQCGKPRGVATRLLI
jgi:hypothetical protein